ncbi:hypothetical protein [Oligoflexus tunisiensis]|uniref:hypothetical protein n=1 Tax=Oligoflexus tunisiensis TaxID=708132 RepID=UPI00114D238B|nr:hypothetical protein [Oligoflexus tunisiensis]
MKKILIVSCLAAAAAGTMFWINSRPSDAVRKPASSAAQDKPEPAPTYVHRDIKELSLPELEAEISKVKEVIEREKLVEVMNDPHGDESRKNEAKKVVRYRLDLAIRKIDLHLSYLETQFAKGQ